jgi:hypothetical protein
MITMLTLAACTSPGQVNQTAAPSVGNTVVPMSQAPPDTRFSRMFSLTPYAFLNEHDLWFGDPGKAKQLYGFGDINSLEAYNKLSGDERKRMAADLMGVIQLGWRWWELAPLVGYDNMMINSLIVVDIPPPWKFSISEGNFDAALIGQKLIEQGYEKKNYGNNTYYSQFDDFQLVPDSPIAAMADLNRIAVFDNTVVTAPATGILTAILDTIAGINQSVIDNAACRSLAASLGDVLSGGFITPERVIDPAPGHSVNLPQFDFVIPQDWGLLHQYEMVGIGYKNDGSRRSWVFSLYYADSNSASADAGTLVKRLASYHFNTQYKDRAGTTLKEMPLTGRFDVGEPAVMNYANGATLTVECRYKPETGNNAWLQPTLMIRDLLFLAPDPSSYIKNGN